MSDRGPTWRHPPRSARRHEVSGLYRPAADCITFTRDESASARSPGGPSRGSSTGKRA